MEFSSILRILRNLQAGTESTPSGPYCPQPGAEPPWLTKARKYVVTREDENRRKANEKLPPSEGRMPTWEDTSDGEDRILRWVAQVNPNAVDEFDPREDGWCAAFLGAMLDDCNLAHSDSLVATSYYYNNWAGRNCGAIHGAIVIYGPRNVAPPPNLEGNNYITGGHAGFLVKDKEGAFKILGGNQSGKVNIAPLTWYNNHRRIWGYRWPRECPCPDEASVQNSP